MEVIGEFIRELAGFMLISSVLEQLIQDGSFRKYYKMVVGLILVYIMAQPLAKVFQFEYTMTEQVVDMEFENEIQELYAAMGEIQTGMTEKISQEELGEYAVHLGEKIKKELKKENFDINTTEVILGINSEGMIEIEKLVVIQNQRHDSEIAAGNWMPENQLFLKRYISKRYDIPQFKIQMESHHQEIGGANGER